MLSSRTPPSAHITVYRPHGPSGDDVINATVVIYGAANVDVLATTLARVADMRARTAVVSDLMVFDRNPTALRRHYITECCARTNLTYLPAPSRPWVWIGEMIRDTAVGDVVLLVGDDVGIGENWVDAYMTAMSQQETIQVFEGPVLAEFDQPISQQTEKNLRYLRMPLALSFGPESYERSWSRPRNMAMRISSARDAKLWKWLDSSLDTECEYPLLQLLSGKTIRDYCVGWVADAIVKRVIESSKSSQTWIRRWYFDFGAATARALLWNGIDKELSPLQLLWRRVLSSDVTLAWFDGPFTLKWLKLTAFAQGFSASHREFGATEVSARAERTATMNNARARRSSGPSAIASSSLGS